MALEARRHDVMLITHELSWMMDAGQAATASDIVMIITTRQYPTGPAV